jgi:uncharacterized protein YerC
MTEPEPEARINLGERLHDCEHCRHWRIDLNTALSSGALSIAETLAGLGDLLAQTREQRGLGLRQVAEQTGVSYSTISRVERGVTETTDVRSALAILTWIETPVAESPRDDS